MTLLYRSRQEALERIVAHYPAHTRRDVIRCQQAKKEFDRQFSNVLMRTKQLCSELMLFSEKGWYSHMANPIGDEDLEVKSVSEKILGEVENHQNFLCQNLGELQKLLKVRRKFYIGYVLPKQILEEREKDE